MAKNKFKTSELLEFTPERVSKLDRKTLSQAVSQLGAIANKRAERLRRHEIGESSALVQYDRSGGKVTVRGKTLNQLRREFTRTQKFLNAKTSTITGAKQVKRDMETRLGVHNWSKEDWSKYWKAYNIILENEDTMIALYKFGSDRLQELLRDEFISGNEDITRVLETADEIIQSQIDLESDYNYGIFDEWGLFD